MRRPTRRNLDFEAMIQDGELAGTNGFVSQTPNGSAMWCGEGWNRLEPWTSEQVVPDKTRPAGRSNRTGE